MMSKTMDYNTDSLHCPDHQDMERAGFANCLICFKIWNLQYEIEKFKKFADFEFKTLQKLIEKKNE
jgi:hypothetical protein